MTVNLKADLSSFTVPQATPTGEWAIDPTRIIKDLFERLFGRNVLPPTTDRTTSLPHHDQSTTAASITTIGYSEEIKILKKDTEQVFVISTTEAVFYEQSKNRLRILQLVPEPTLPHLVREFIYTSIKVENDAYYVWNMINSAEVIQTSLKYGTTSDFGVRRSYDKDFEREMSKLSIKSKSVIGSYVKSFYFYSLCTESELISLATGLETLVEGGYSRSYRGRQILTVNKINLKHGINAFLQGLQTFEDPEMTLLGILPRLRQEDKWILYKYLYESEIDSIKDLVFRKIAENLRPDLSKIENLRTYLNHPIDREEWKWIFPLLQTFVSSGEAGSDTPSAQVMELIGIALNQAVKSKYPDAITFLLTTFPFLKTKRLEEGYNWFNFRDQEKIVCCSRLEDPFHLALNVGDIGSITAFLATGWDLRKKAGEEIIKKLLLKDVAVPDETIRVYIEEPLASKREIFTLLLKHGLDPNLIMEGASGLPSPMAQTFFQHKNPQIKQLGLYLFDNGVEMSSQVVEKMKLDLAQDPEYARLLIKQGKATAEEIRYLTAPPVPIASRDSLIGRMSISKIVINKLHRRYTANPFIEDFKDLEEIRSLKKEVKKYLLAHPDDVDLKMIYATFSSEYDALVTNHYLLSKIREISQQLRAYVKAPTSPDGSAAIASTSAKPPLSLRVISIFNLWNPIAGPIICGAENLISTLDSTSCSAHFQIVRSNLLKYVSLVNSDFFWRDKHVTCFHGTKLAPDMLKEEALVPAGMMLDTEDGAIVQFAGERCGSSMGHNKLNTSCVKPAKDWDHIEYTMLHSVSTPMLVSEVYAKQIFGLGEVETVFDYEASKMRATWEFINRTVFNDAEISLIALQHCYTDILRVRAWDRDNETCLSHLLPKIHEVLTDPSTPKEHLEGLILLQQALTIKIRYPLNASDRDLIECPIPIVFASTSLSPRKLSPYSQEYLIEGKADFRKDLQVAFVREEDTVRARDLLTTHGLAVYPLEIAHAIETDRMIRGGDIKVRSVALSNSQAILGALLQQDILPYYGRPLAERPSYKTATGHKQFVERPFWGRGFSSYEDYKNQVDETAAIPRFIHGKMHAVRTAMAAQLWANIYSAMKGALIVEDRNLLALAAAAHDAHRQDEGGDHWDEASGSALYSYLASREYPKETCELYSQALIEKDPTLRDPGGKPIFTSDEQRIIHDADTLEIMRVLGDKKEFQRERLAADAVWEETKQQALSKVPEGDQIALREANEKILAIEADLQNIVVEWGHFIDMTEKPELKMLLEYTPSIDYYTEVMKILKYLTDKEELPTLKKFLAGELSLITSEPSAEVIKLLT